MGGFINKLKQIEKKMKKKLFGENQIEYKAEAGDKVVSTVESPYRSEPRPVVVKSTGKAVNITTYGIRCTWEGKEIFLKLTAGQYKVLTKIPDLTGKTIIFESYESKKGFGTLVGARVKK